MEKFRVFFAVITAIRSSARRKGDRWMKQAIGDSMKNNRTPSVNQVIRLSNKDLVSKELTVVYSILKPYMVKARLDRGSKRTDAFDMNEFVTVYRDKVMNKKQLRRQVGQALGRI